MHWSHEGASDKIKDIQEEFGWGPAKARRFHDWLEDNYSSEKDNMSYSELREAAGKFNEEDKDQWDD